MTRSVWEIVRDTLKRGMHFYVLNYVLEPTAVVEASTQQGFIDILDDDVIKPLRAMKVSQHCLVQAEFPVLI